MFTFAGMRWKMLILLLLLARPLAAPAQETDGLRIMFWNLENFFDWHRDSTGSGYDEVFTATGERHWTRKRFERKCEKIAKAIFWVSDCCGGLPDVIGFAEVENRFVLNCLLKYTILEKLDYKIVHYDSPDRRGIDVTLMYRESSVKLRESRPVRVVAARNGDSLRTRDILVAGFSLASGGSFTLAVNHHPSKFGGGDSDWRRQAAIDSLESVALRAEGDFFVATGDFNDTPDNPAYSALEEAAGLKNLAAPLARQGLGTIRFEGRWELIDMFFVSRGLEASMQIIKVPFLMTRDNVHAGEKPLRTYSGPRYIGGVSDHLPIILTIPRVKTLE